MKRALAILAAAVALVPSAAAFAQGYPTKPVHMIVAFAPGGPVDTVARIVGQKLVDLLGEPIVVENRPSASGNIGAQVVSRAAPDGYTILVTSSAFAVNATLFKDPGYEPRDFAPIVQAATQPNVIVVKADFPAKTLGQLLE